MAGDDTFSADTDDLGAFVGASRDEVVSLTDTWTALRAGRDLLATSPLPAFVETTTLDRYRDLVEQLGENGRFVSDIVDALLDHGDHLGEARYLVSTELVEAELARTTDERLDRLEAELEAGGVDPAEARKVRDEVAAQLAADPTLGFGEAVRLGLAAYRGVDLEEAERMLRAFALTPPEVGIELGQHFDEIAGRTGRGDQITLDDLHAVIADPTAPSDLRDLAYRVAADPVLFNNLDTAHQTDLSAEPLTNGFAWNEADGIIGRDDVAEFPERDHQARILLAWHPLVVTAGQGYDLGRADSHVSADDVKAFVGDGDIPLHVRLAVFDVYAERHGLDLDQRVELEEELAFDATGFVGGTTVLEVGGGTVPARTPLLVPPGSTTGAPSAGGSGGGGGAGAAILAQVLIVGTQIGWRQGRLAAIERDGEPRFIHTDPLTGRETVVDPAQLAELTPAQAKAWVAHFAATGLAPTELSDTIAPSPYLDPFGQWRMSDTNEPVRLPPAPEGQFWDTEKKLRYRHNGELVEPEPEPELATDGAGGRSGGGSDGKRRFNVERSESPVWQTLQVYRDGIRTNGLTGRKLRYYTWDKTHNDIEVFDQNDFHLGSMDPVTGEMYKPPVPTRKLKR